MPYGPAPTTSVNCSPKIGLEIQFRLTGSSSMFKGNPLPGEQR